MTIDGIKDVMLNDVILRTLEAVDWKCTDLDLILVDCLCAIAGGNRTEENLTRTSMKGELIQIVSDAPASLLSVTNCKVSL